MDVNADGQNDGLSLHSRHAASLTISLDPPFPASIRILRRSLVPLPPRLFTAIPPNLIPRTNLHSISSGIFLLLDFAHNHVYLCSIRIYRQLKLLLHYILYHIMIRVSCNVDRLLQLDRAIGTRTHFLVPPPSKLWKLCIRRTVALNPSTGWL